MKFIGDNTHALLPEIKIKNYNKEYSKFSNTKMKKLSNSIKQANEIIDRKIKISKLYIKSR